ncbi:putative Na+/H+ antiporter [Actinoplanes sp. NBRC 14428]|uniref:Sodium/proton antiporter (CPA1 family) n=1 Tax=Pseudosporangium ferrugineum TaxID=439699 RepID=A0A2T0RE22_9ACTN|nr:Na+/H+ antiporter [Pseudosporangium ferrugineum]PRY19444.1 sodium/proton antiporter (CPA1 family) [Pseudosporangium ferrugineum]BCJ52560.1 putative Na+/H+ antiporter [Actinoplanes sp. NBRC 14428]
MSVETTLLFILACVAVVVAVRWFADRTGLPAAALLTLLGILYALLPGPNVELEPELILTLVLPPLLYNAALDSSLVDIRRNLRTVISLSVVLVLLTALLIGVGFHYLVAGATLAAGVALGAAVAPPDPVAALAVGKKVGLPRNIVTLVQGEGLLNDATALTLLSVAISAAVGQEFSFSAAVGEFVISAAGGVIAGIVVAYAVRAARPIQHDPLIANAVSLATPFVAYLAAERVHVSGVLAVVVAGLIVGHDAPRLSSGASRLQVSAVWRLVDFLLEGLVFLLIGQQLPWVIEGLSEYETSTIVIAVAVSTGVVLLLRPLFLVLTQMLPRSMHARLGGDPAAEQSNSERERRLDGKEITALTWSGTRGVITLAAVFTIPHHTDAGLPFPDRDLLLFCAFVVVLVTLVGQGITFAPLVRMLGLKANEADKVRLRNEARSASVQAALDRLDEIHLQRHDHVEDQAIETMRKQLDSRLERYRRRLDLLEQSDSDEVPVSPQYEAALKVRRSVIDAQREELLRWRDAGRLSDEGMRVLERELDHEERLLPDRPRDG